MGGYIGNEPTTGHFPVDNFTSSGGSTYTLSKAPGSAGAIEVSVQGVLQPTTAYTVSGTTLTMAGVTSGVKIFVRHLGETLSLPTPADGSVTTTKLAVNAVDGTKIAMGSDAQGDILYHGASDYTRLAKGTAGQSLVMNSGATAPEWGIGGKLLQLAHTTAAFTSTAISTTNNTWTDTDVLITFTPVSKSPCRAREQLIAQGHPFQAPAAIRGVITDANPAPHVLQVIPTGAFQVNDLLHRVIRDHNVITGGCLNPVSVCRDELQPHWRQGPTDSPITDGIIRGTCAHPLNGERHIVICLSNDV